MGGTPRSKTALAVLLLCAVVVALLLIGGIYIALFLVTQAHQMPFRRGEFDRVVHDIESGRLVPNADGIVDLPTTSRSLTDDGLTYVTRLADGTHLELLVVWRGKGSNLRGYLHCGRPLTTRDLIRLAAPSGPASVTVVGPRVPSPGSPALSEPLQVDLEQQVAPSWYRVSYTLD